MLRIKFNRSKLPSEMKLDKKQHTKLKEKSSKYYFRQLEIKKEWRDCMITHRQGYRKRWVSM